jgi:hypothetical protein
MSDSDEKAVETGTLDPERNIDVVQQRLELDRKRLELDRQRLKLDVEAHETSKQLHLEKILLEKSKERTARLQLILPVLISIFAIGLGIWTATLQYRLQYAQAVSSYNETRLELFKSLVLHPTDTAGVKQAYIDTFPNDSKTLESEKLHNK